METTLEFLPPVTRLDQFDQPAEIARLSDFARQVSTEEMRVYVNDNLVCADQTDWDDIHKKFTKHVIGSTILKLIDANLLGFGALVGCDDLKQAFGAVQRSDDALDYIRRRILPLDCIAGSLLILLTHGCLFVEIEEHCGAPDFVFGLAGDRIATITKILEELDSELEGEANTTETTD